MLLVGVAIEVAAIANAKPGDQSAFRRDDDRSLKNQSTTKDHRCGCVWIELQVEGLGTSFLNKTLGVTRERNQGIGLENNGVAAFLLFLLGVRRTTAFGESEGVFAC